MFDKCTDDIRSVNVGADSLEIGHNLKMSASTFLITVVPGKYIHTGACDEQLCCVIKVAAVGVTAAVAEGSRLFVVTMFRVFCTAKK